MSAEEPLPDRVVRTADGTIALRLVEREREILRALVEDLGLVIGAPALPDDPWDADVRTTLVGHLDPFADAVDEDGEEAVPVDIATADIRARLYPSAAPDDPKQDAAYRRLVHEDLEAGRRARIAVVEATLGARTLDDEQAEAWLHTLNDLRLVLGTRLGVTDDAGEVEPDPDDPQAAARIIYAYTGWLEGQFVDVLAAALPDVTGSPGSVADDPDESAREDDS